MDLLLDDAVLATVHGDPAAVDVTDVVHDHRQAGPGALFCCMAGHRHDGHRFAAQAVAAGAVGLLVEHPVPELLAPGASPPVPQAVVVPGAMRQAMAGAACRLWDHPSRHLAVIGVTGTNGKTSVTHLLAAILSAAGRPTAVVGTLSGARTTPEAPDLQRRLAAAHAAGDQAVAMEVSSHALAQDRVHGTWFTAGVFTNLGHDHLDFHGTREAYFEAKARLFEPERCGVAVVNRDDPCGQRLIERCQADHTPVVTFGEDDATDVVVQPWGSTWHWRGRSVRLPVPGAYQVVNALAAAATAAALGVTDEAVVAGLAGARPIPGRFEVVATRPAVDATIVVDFAHTPDALQVTLASARAVAGTGRVLCVIGCGGDRDRAKRPVMGAVAAGAADVVVVTSDNARSEEPEAIVAEIVAGARSAITSGAPGVVVVEVDRARAIGRALDLAGPGDVVVVAGKGHETTMEIGGATVAFDDREVVRSLVARSAGPRAGTVGSVGGTASSPHGAAADTKGRTT